jgi:hypothetical protein
MQQQQLKQSFLPSLGRRRLALCGLAATALVAATLSVAPQAAHAQSQTMAQSRPTDAQSAPDAVSAAAIAQAYGHSVLITGDTDATDETSAKPDGSMTLTESTEPERALVGSTWTPINTSLALEPNGLYAPAVADVPVQFSGGGTGPMAEEQAPTGQWLSETWPAGSLPTPTVSGAVATYQNVLPGVDVILTATNTGMTEVLAINSASAATDPGLAAVQLGLAGNGLNVEPLSDGGADADSGTAPELQTDSATWWDASGGGTAAGPGPLAVERPATSSVSSTAVTLNAQTEAQAPNVTYPVYVDPDWEATAGPHGFIDSAYPNTNYYDNSGASDGYEHVGYINAAWSNDGLNHTTRGYWEMNTSGLVGKHILAAQFGDYEEYSSSCTAEGVELWTISGPNTGTTWNHPMTWYTEVGTQTVAYGYNSSCPGQSVGWDTTSVVASNAAASGANIAFGMRATDETNNLSWKKFNGDATLTVTYNSIPTQPAGRGISPCPFECANPVQTSGNGTTAPLTLDAESFDDDGGNLTYLFQIFKGYSPANGAPVIYHGDVTEPEGQPAALVITNANGLLPDGQYSYNVDASDGIDTSPFSSGYVGFNIETGHPATPADDGTNTSPSFTIGKAGTIALDAGTQAGNESTYAYEYSWTNDVNTQLQNGADTSCNSTPQQLSPATGDGYPVYLVCPSNAATTGKISPISPPDQGDTLYFRAIDAAGNVSASQPGTFTPPNVAEDPAGAAPAHQWIPDSCTTANTAIADVGSAANDPLSVSGSTAPSCTADGTNSDPNGNPIQLSNNAYSFTASSKDAAIGSAAATTPGAGFSVGAWVYPSATSGNYNDFLSQDPSGSGTNSGFYLRLSASKDWAFSVPTAAGYVQVTGTTAAELDNWAYVVGVWDPGNDQIRLYVNGTLSGVVNVPAALTVEQGNVIEGRAYTNAPYDYFNGQLAGAFVADGTMDQSQVQNEQFTTL